MTGPNKSFSAINDVVRISNDENASSIQSALDNLDTSASKTHVVIVEEGEYNFGNTDLLINGFVGNLKFICRGSLIFDDGRVIFGSGVGDKCEYIRCDFGQILGPDMTTRSNHGLEARRLNDSIITFDRIWGRDKAIYVTNPGGDCLDVKWKGQRIRECNNAIEIDSTANNTEGHWTEVGFISHCDKGWYGHGGGTLHNRHDGSIDNVDVTNSTDIEDEDGNNIFMCHFFRPDSSILNRNSQVHFRRGMYGRGSVYDVAGDGSNTLAFETDGSSNTNFQNNDAYNIGALKFNDRMLPTSQDLTVTNGVEDDEIRMHDGSGTPPQDLYWWDAGGSVWVRVGDETTTI